MQILYRIPDEFIPVDINELRPKDSYKNLIKKRTHNLDVLIKKFGKIPQDLLIDRACPSCASNKHKTIILKDHLKIVKCLKCNLVFVNPIFNEEHYKKTYQSQEYQKIVRELGEDSHNYRLDRFGNERVEIMRQFVKGNDISYLDVGCSTGFVVEAALKQGWKAMGVELNPSAVAFGKKRGLNIIEGDLSNEALEGKHFDIISLFDVLEHLPNPKEIMESVIEKLNSRGIVFLYVPNFDSASRILMGPEAHFIWPSHHLNYYTPETVKFFLESLNLKIEYLATEGLDIVDYIWYQEEVKKKNMERLKDIQDELQFFINAGCYGKNLRVIARKL